MRQRLPTLLWLLATVALLALLVWLLQTPATPHWQTANDVAPASFAGQPVVSLPELSDAERAVTWQQPLFSPDRQPDPVGHAFEARPLPALTVTGIFVSGDVRWLYLQEPGKPGIRLAPGDTLTGGWTLSELSAQDATFTRQGERRTLSLPVKRLPPSSQYAPKTLPSIKTP